MSEEEQEETSSKGFPRWILYIGALVGVNVLSYVFDWSFWIY